MSEPEKLGTILNSMEQVSVKGSKEAIALIECIDYLKAKIIALEKK